MDRITGENLGLVKYLTSNIISLLQRFYLAFYEGEDMFVRVCLWIPESGYTERKKLESPTFCEIG